MCKNTLAGLLIFLFLIVLMGCHTLHGAGQDIESAGKSIERATDK